MPKKVKYAGITKEKAKVGKQAITPIAPPTKYAKKPPLYELTARGIITKTEDIIVQKTSETVK